MSCRDVLADEDERLWRSLRVTGRPFQSASDLAVAGNDLMQLWCRKSANEASPACQMAKLAPPCMNIIKKS